MGDLGTIFSFRDYAQSLAIQGMMAPRDIALAGNAVIGSLIGATVFLFGLMLVRRSGTAAAGFALAALTALLQAIIFGRLDFLTPGTELLIGCLTASALLLFVNAVLHTGTENIFVAGLSAVVIGVLTVTGALSAGGLDYAAAAQTSIFSACVLSTILLTYAVVRDPGGRGIMGLSALVALTGVIMMAPAPSAFLDGVFPTVLPALMTSFGVLIATLTAPFLGQDVRISRSRRARDRSPATALGASLFGDDDDPREHRAPLPPRLDDPMKRLREGGDPFAGQEDSEPVFEQRSEPPRFMQPPEVRPEAERETSPRFAAADPFYTDARERVSAAPSQEPVSSLWQKAGAAPYEPEPGEYVWDSYAEREVMAGDEVLHAFGTRHAEELSPEGLRGRLAPSSLPVFDDEVLGGSDPRSGPFSVTLRTHDREFDFRGRRQVDHDGILMRIDGEIRGLRNIDVKPETISYPDHPGHRGQYAAVVRLSDEAAVGFEAIPTASLSDHDEVKALILDAGRHLAELLHAEPSSGAFALIDASTLAVRPGVIAGAVGKAVRVHELPRGAIVVGMKARDAKSMKDIAPLADDIRKAGGGVALFLDEKLAKGVKFDPDMVWVSASDIDLETPRKRNVLGQLTKRFGAPILVRDVRDGSDSNLASANGALFGMGRAYSGITPPATASSGRGSADAFGTQDPDRNRDRTALSSLRAGGLR